MLDLDQVESRLILSLHSDADVLCLFHYFFDYIPMIPSLFQGSLFLYCFFFVYSDLQAPESRSITLGYYLLSIKQDDMPFLYNMPFLINSSFLCN